MLRTPTRGWGQKGKEGRDGSGRNSRENFPESIIVLVVRWVGWGAETPISVGLSAPVETAEGHAASQTRMHNPSSKSG